MSKQLEISQEAFDLLLNDSIGQADLSEHLLMDKGRLGSWHGTILTSYTLNCAA